ncbi:hypothetical protein SAMN05444148_2377 [Winogradskyella jejuensis]|uniref:Uncharacterized protein n=1 Tax=Winogradskyella jejuensis TaxID=1089305 RepID=A0A1M5U617_9FLAO|nr:hypothetical protein SAMN05444148_2377 [Winogradskyella jejuensis]
MYPPINLPDTLKNSKVARFIYYFTFEICAINSASAHNLPLA